MARHMFPAKQQRLCTFALRLAHELRQTDRPLLPAAVVLDSSISLEFDLLPAPTMCSLRVKHADMHCLQLQTA